MAQTAIRIKTCVLPGKRLEVTSDELTENAEVELIVVEDTRASRTVEREYRDVVAFLESLPPIRRTLAEWAAASREVTEERDAWDRWFSQMAVLSTQTRRSRSTPQITTCGARRAARRCGLRWRPGD